MKNGVLTALPINDILAKRVYKLTPELIEQAKQLYLKDKTKWINLLVLNTFF